MTTVFDPVGFRALYPAFNDHGIYTDAILQANFNMAGSFIANANSGCQGLTQPQQAVALNMMTAHLLAISAGIASGDTPGIVTAAGIDKVSVTLMAPLVKSQWAQWLVGTPYGSSLYAFLQGIAVGGMYVGGLPELSAFRKVGGFY